MSAPGQDCPVLVSVHNPPFAFRSAALCRSVRPMPSACRLPAVCRIGIGQRARAVPVNLHAIRQQRIQTENLVSSAADDLTVGIAPQNTKETPKPL